MMKKLSALCLIGLIVLAACTPTPKIGVRSATPKIGVRSATPKIGVRSATASPPPPTETAAPTETHVEPTRTPTLPSPTAAPTSSPKAATPAATLGATAGLISPLTADGLKNIQLLTVQEPASRWLWASDGKLVVETVKGYTRFDLATLQLLGSSDKSFAKQVITTSADATRAVSMQKDGSLQVWDLASRQVIQTLQPAETPTGAVFSPDVQMLAVTSADTISAALWDVASGKQTTVLKGFETAAPTYRVQFSPDGRTLVWIARATVQFMDIASGQMGARLSFEDFANTVVFAPDGKTAAIAVADFVSLAQVSDGKEIQHLTLANPCLSLAYSPDGRLLALAVGNDIDIRNASTGKTIATLKGHSSMVRLVGFAPDGRSLLSSADDGSVIIWRVLP